MKPDMILSSDPLDILFEDRNKAYGAYALRKEYSRRLLMALCSIPIITGLFWWGSLMNKAVHSGIMAAPEVIDVVMQKVTMEKPEPPKPLEAPRQKPVATIKNTPPVIVPDHVKTDPTPVVDDLMKDDRAISDKTGEGAPPTSISSPASAVNTGTGNAPVAEPVAAPPPVLQAAEQMPEFPGGIDGLRRFLGRNLRVPENVMEAGQQVKVPIRFVVSKNGELSNVEFLVQADEAFKNEILRVMSKMPKWKPGVQNGHNVAVYFAIPIVFEVAEE